MARSRGGSRTPTALPALAAAATLALVLCRPHRWGQTFTGAARPVLRAPAAGLVARAAESKAYPELSRVEDLIYDSCMLYEEPREELQCLRTLDKLTKFHEKSKLECSLDSFHCIVLDVLDRLCAGIQGRDGIVLLNRVASAVLSFRNKFVTWEQAFGKADHDGKGHLDVEKLTALMRSSQAGLTDEEVRAIFFAADANGDGSISPQEFSDFLTAAVFAEEPLRQLQVDPLPTKRGDLEDYLRWSSSGSSGGSWSGLSRIR